MLLRIALIIAVATGIGALGVSFKVSERITQITTERDEAREARDQALAAQRTAEQEAKEAQEELAKTEEQLNVVQKKLDSTMARAKEQEARANQLNAELQQVTKERNTAQASLERWRNIDLTIEQVINLRDALANVRQERAVLQQENEVLQRRVSILENDLNYYVGEDTEVEMPGGVHGEVTAVNQEYGFVVVNVGSEQGVLQRGKLTVARDGQLVGKVQVTSIQEGRSIANVLSGWTENDIQVGDTVLTSYEAMGRR